MSPKVQITPAVGLEHNEYGRGWEVLVIAIAFIRFMLIPLLFVCFGIVCEVEMAWSRTWYTWPSMVAGPIIGVGCLLRNLSPINDGDPSEMPAPSAFAGLIDLGAALLSLTAFTTFFRTLWWAMPAQSPELANRCSRDTRIGQFLLMLSSTVFVAVCSRPDVRQYLVLALQMPFYLYFFTVAFGYVRRSKSWTVPENQPLLSEREAPWRRILYIAIFIEVILAMRAVLISLYLAVFFDDKWFGSMMDDLALLACYIIFFHNRPDKRLPPEYTTLHFEGSQKHVVPGTWFADEGRRE